MIIDGPTLVDVPAERDTDATAVLATALPGLPPTGTYQLRADRCVVEVSYRPFGVPLVFGRFQPTAGRVRVPDDGTEPELSLAVLADSLRTGVPGLGRIARRAFDIGDRDTRTIEFESAELTAAARGQLRIAGRFGVGEIVHHLVLEARVVHVSPSGIVLSARGRTKPIPRVKRARFRPFAALIAGRAVHVEIAADYTA